MWKMASMGDSHSIVINLELSFQCQYNKRLEDGLQALAKELKSDIYHLKDHLTKTGEFGCVFITDVFLQNGRVFISFALYNEQQLERLYQCLKDRGNRLSEVISSYCYDNALEITAGLPLDTKLKCSICMPRKTFLQCQIDFCTDGESTDSLTNAMNGEDQTSTQQLPAAGNVKKTVDIINKASLPGSYPRSVVTSSVGDVCKTELSNNQGELLAESVPPNYQINVWNGSQVSHSQGSKLGLQQDGALDNTHQTDCVQYEPQHEGIVNAVRKRFLLFCPEKAGVTVKKVFIQSYSNECLNGEMKHHFDNIYEYNVDLPLSHIHSGPYYYVCVAKRSALLGLTSRDITFNSILFPLDSSCTVKRDVLHHKDGNIRDVHAFDENWTYEHLRDIIFHCADDAYSENDCCMQIQNVTIKPLVRQYALRIVRRLGANLICYQPISCVLFTVAVGNLLKSMSYILQDGIITPEIALFVIKNLTSSSLTDLSESCKQYAHSACYAFCKKGYGAEVPEIQVLNLCYSFYGDTYLRKLITDDKICQSMQDDNKSMKALHELCAQLYEQKSSTAQQLIDLIMRRVPVSMALGVLSKMFKPKSECSECELHMQSALYESTVEQIQTELNKVKKNRTSTFENLKSFLSIVAKHENVWKLFQDKFEESFISIIETCSADAYVRDPTFISSLIADYEMFNESMQKQILVDAIISSQNQYVLQQFIPLSELSQMTSVFSTFNGNKFAEFCKNFLHAKDRNSSAYSNDEFRQRITDLAVLWNIPTLTKLENIRRVLVNVSRHEFNRHHITKLLYSLDVVDELSSTSSTIFDICLVHITGWLKETSEPPEAVLKMMRAVTGVPNLKTKLSAEVVNKVLDMFGSLPDTLSDIGRFEILLDNFQFWATIFSCTGKFKDDVKKHENYVNAQKCIKNIAELFRRHEIQYDFIVNIERNIQRTSAAKRLLRTYLNDHVVETLWRESRSVFKKMLEKLACVEDVMNEIKNNEPRLSDEFAVVINRLRKSVTKLKSGNITAGECEIECTIWENIEELPELCKDLKDYVQSSVFWNICQKMAFEEFNLKYEQTIEDHSICSIRQLFQEGESDDYGDIECGTICQMYVWVLFQTGHSEYRDTWFELKSNDTFMMDQIQSMFGSNPDVRNEIEIAERILHLHIRKSSAETLHRIYYIQHVAETVKSIEKMINVFDIDPSKDETYKTAVTAFHQLLSGTAERSTFKDVQKALETVFVLVGLLSENTIHAILTLGSASTLVQFLKSIVDEDIKNLIDAVEDISEQQVQESTVSALIEVKQYLHPLLVFESSGKCTDMLKLLEKQTLACGSSSKSLPQKIEDCVQNVHNLRSLYNGLANRSEQTKEIVCTILQHGTYCFQLSDTYSTVEFDVVYIQNENQEIRKQSTLIDLRSRALLLMNTSRTEEHYDHKGNDELIHFIQDIDMCIDIAEILFALHIAGHISYMDIDDSIPSDELSVQKEQLQITLNEWQADLAKERSVHYLMNFIHGNQIHILHNYLEHLDFQMQAVQAILTFIHPDIKAMKVKCNYEEEIQREESFGNRCMLHCIGHALHSSYEGMEVRRRAINDNRSKTLTDLVQSGKLMVAQLDEGSLHTVKTLLSLYINTTQCLPEPSHILFCTRETSWIELELLIQRCIGAYDFYGVPTLFCIAHVEMLPGELQFKLVETLRHLERGAQYLLAVICRGSRNHPFVDELSDCVYAVKPVTDRTVQDIFIAHCSNVHTLTSELAGQGKSTYIKTVANKLAKSAVTLHISGQLRKLVLVDRLSNLDVKSHHVLHIDIGNVDEPSELDTFLFELVVLKHVSAGRTAVKLGSQDVYIELANTINDTLRNSLHTTVLFQRTTLNLKGIEHFLISSEMHSPAQIVCHYLKNLDNGTLDNMDITIEHGLRKPMSRRHCKDLLSEYIFREDNETFPVMHTVINVLADQLKKMSHSSFFKISRLREMVGNKNPIYVKSKLVKAMINVAVEFATRSVDNCRDTQATTVNPLIEDINLARPSHDVATSITKRTDGMIRWEDSNHLMFVFHNQNIHTLSALYRHLSKVPNDIRNLFDSQMKKDMVDFSSLEQSHFQDYLQKIARINPLPLKQDRLNELSLNYALTADNLLKMVLIMLRIKANIPVLVMGETGCGKTSLIRYLASVCEVDFEVFNIHAGIPEEEIIRCVIKNNAQAIAHFEKERWLFLDEINTSDSIGLMSDVICHHKCLGHELSPNLIVMAACNPYKLRTTKDISTAGLEGKVKTDELSKLVYRVLPIPEIMVDYVWDFGSLNEKDEEMYIHRMIHDVFPRDERFHNLYTGLLSVSQAFVREQEESQYSVSLRDVQRCRILSKWFLEVLPKKTRTDHSKMAGLDVRIKAMILALAHCYQSRFSKKPIRKEYRTVIGNMFTSHNMMFDDCHESFINKVIKYEQADILRRMKLPPGIACNTALQENVFVILVCIFNRIPIFVVGKPGCSKSLAMLLIKSNLRGKDSEDDFFKTLPQLYCVSFQGSESSTSDGIVKVFKKAEKYQDSNSSDEVLSVVILDEIGLAEVSRFNPLKVLHSLLEPEGQSQPNVAVVGISNWALDASKMNRAIHLSRPDMDEEELFETAVSISESFINREVKSSTTTLFRASADTRVKNCEPITPYLKGMAAAYCQYITELRFKHFHGLRDYYSLVKYVSRVFAECDDVSSELENAEVIMNGIARNFGGLQEEIHTLYDVFQANIPSLHVTHRPLLEIVAENIADPIARHLMLITTGESVLGILDQKLKTMKTKQKEIIFGSQFEEDLTDDYNYRILSKIILCMEQGLILVLKDLDSIYGSLYDMLNQNYTVIGKKKNCRVALGPYSNPICHVAENFRCIVLVDEGKLDLTDPPFLNRFEKQYLRFSDIIQDKHEYVINELEAWVQGLSHTNSKTTKKETLFPIYSKDLIASLVLKIESAFEENWEDVTPENTLVEECKHRLLMIMKPEAIVRQQRIHESHTSGMESLIRKYFGLPIHYGLKHYLVHQLEHTSEEGMNDGMLTVVFTNSNVHTKLRCDDPDLRIQVEKLGAFKSEKQLTSRVQMFWNDKNSNHLLVQCNAKEEEHHILLTKLIVERCRNEYKTRTNCESKHVYFIIHLDRSNTSNDTLSQLNFLSDWSLVMLDSIDTPRIPLPQLYKMSLHEAIFGRKPLDNVLKEELFWAFSRIRYEAHGRDVKSISKAISQIGDSNELLEILENEIFGWIHRQYDVMPDRYWACEVSCDITALQSSSGFVDALEKYIMDKINTPLAKLIYQIELTGMLDSFFMEDMNDSPECDEFVIEKRKIWVSCLRNRCAVAMSDILDASGPECYTCTTHDWHLRMPCSKSIYEVIETTRSDFMDMLCEYRVHCLLEDEEELPVEVYEEVLKQQECFILEKIPGLNDYTYTNWYVDYYEDFCSMTTDSLLTGTDKLRRKPFLKHILNRECVEYTGDSFAYVIRLHTLVWAHYDSICAELRLIDNCLDKMTECEPALMKVLSPVETAGEIVYSSEAVEESNSCDENSDECTIDESGAFGDTHIELCDFFNIFETSDVRNSEMFNSELLSTGSGSDRDESEQESQNDVCNDVHDRLVNCVCELLLPTTKCLDLHGGISNWLLVVDTTVSLAARVSRNPELLYSLKACSELAQELIIPFKLDQNLLENIGELLLHNPLDSELVFSGVMEIVDKVVNDEASPPNEDLLTCYQTLSSYFVRCTAANPCTTILSKLFQLVIENKIPPQCILLFKVPLDTILQAIDEEVFGNLLNNQHYFSTENECKDDIRERDEVVLESVNDMIVCLFNADCFDSPILVMIVDILEAAFTNLYFDCDRENTADHFCSDEVISATLGIDDKVVRDLFYECHKSLKSPEPGMQYLASIAFCKCFIHYAVDAIETGTDDEQTRMMNIVSIVLTDLMTHGVHSLVVFMFKVLSNGKTFSQLQQFCNLYAERFKFLLPLQIDTFAQHLSNSVLCIHVKDDLHHQRCFCCQDISSSYKDGIDILVENANKDTDALIQLFAFGIREFYLRQCHTDLDDSNRTQGDILLNEVLDLSLDDPIVAFCKCVIGHDNFKIKDFSLDKSSTQPDICVVSSVVNLIGLSLAHNASRIKDTEIPILSKALLHPGSLDTCVLPGFERHLDHWSDEKRIYVGNCTCRNRLVTLETSCSICVICDAEIELNCAEPEEDADLEGLKPLSENSMLIYNRNPVTYHVLQFLVKACTLGSFALGISDTAKVKVLSKSPLNEAGDMLLKEVFQHWDCIRKLVNVGHNEMTSLFHYFLLKAEGLLFKTDCPCNSIEEAHTFEERLDTIVEAVFGDKASSLQNVHHKHNLIHQQTGSGREFENQLFEVEDLSSMPREEYVLQVPPLYRLTTSPTKTNFMFELCQRNHQFQLLETVLLEENRLSLPHHIMSIVMWHLATVANASYMIRKQECLKMSVQEFVYFKSDTMKKDVMKRRFDEFRKSWEILKTELKGTNLAKDMKRIHIETKMMECMLLDEHSVVSRVLHALIAVQNRFLDNIARIAYSSKSLQILMKGSVAVVPCVPVTELKAEYLLNVQIDWDSLLEDESHCDVTYGHGTQVQYDFYRIEECITKAVVTGKKYITSVGNLPKILFIDELHLNYASLLKEIAENVGQKELPADIRSGIISRKENDPRMASELLNHLGVVMTVVKRTKADPEQPLVEFVDSWKSIMCRQFPKTLLPSPESSVKLCHVVALSELLEELCAETIRDGLADKYRESLDMPLRDHLVKVLKDEYLSSTLFKSLKRFIYRCLSSNTADPEQSIRMYLADGSFWPKDTFQDNKIHTLEAQYPVEDILPDGMMVRHISECIDVIESEIEKRQKESMKLSGFASSFQRSKTTPKVQKSMQRKKTAVKIRMF